MALKATNMERDPRHGKYDPWSIYSEDQIPVPFYNGGTSTYADRGSVDVRMALPSGDIECTVVVSFKLYIGVLSCKRV